VVLHGEHRQSPVMETFQCTIIQIDVGHFEVVRERFGVDRETMILGRDFDSTGLLIAHRMICAPVPEFEFVGRCPQRQTQKLVPQTDAEDRRPIRFCQTVNQLSQHGDRTAESGRVARPV